MWVSCLLGRSRMTDKPLAFRDWFARNVYALLPIALSYHLAHNLEHLLMEGPKVVTLISDPFGWDQNWFGTARWNRSEEHTSELQSPC